MGITIKGSGNGNEAKVTDDLQLETKAVVTSLQHFISHHKGKAYQVSGTATISTSSLAVLYLRNDDSNHDLVVTYIRLMSVGAAATNVAGYFTVVLGDALTSGGDTLTPINMHQGSSNTANVSARDHGGTLAVTGGSEIDRDYTANAMQSYSKEGTIILPPGKSITVHHIGSTVAGTAYARLSFFMDHTSV